MRRFCITIASLLVGAVAHSIAIAELSVDLEIDIEEVPFRYSDTEADNRVSRLIAKLKSKEIELEYTRQHGYLQSLLAALEIPESSQTLVFSKTSMQVRYISRRNPRAIYFNDDTYLGWVNGSSLVEISTTDPKLGTAFYTVNMMPWRPGIQRRNYDCLACHATSMTQGIPGHTIRSVFPKYDGGIDSQKGSFITDDTSPFSERWGGWYVTGLHGDMRHMGNSYLRGGQLDTQRNGNRISVRSEFDSSNYLSPHSDIVALMVLEHQTQTHNAMVRADFFIRQLLHDASTVGQSVESDPEWRLQLQAIAKQVVNRMLFCGETRLTSAVQGGMSFADDFTARGRKDVQGRSLREFDLKNRMFKYPLSYLIHSDAFDSLQPRLRQEIYRQLHQVLSGENQADDYKHLGPGTRSATLAILRATKDDFPF